jgi:hypothetical protein
MFLSLLSDLVMIVFTEPTLIVFTLLNLKLSLNLS